MDTPEVSIERVVEIGDASCGEILRIAADTYLWDGESNLRGIASAVGTCTAIGRLLYFAKINSLEEQEQVIRTQNKYRHVLCSLPYGEYNVYLEFGDKSFKERQAIRYMFLYFVSYMFDDEDKMARAAARAVPNSINNPAE